MKKMSMKAGRAFKTSSASAWGKLWRCRAVRVLCRVYVRVDRELRGSQMRLGLLGMGAVVCECGFCFY